MAYENRLAISRPTTFVPSPDASLGDGDGAARRPYQHFALARQTGSGKIGLWSGDGRQGA